MGPLGELGALFNPGMRHEIEERQSKANRREEEGNARDGDLRIDLASGVAVINVRGRSGSPAASDEPSHFLDKPAHDVDQPARGVETGRAHPGAAAVHEAAVREAAGSQAPGSDAADRDAAAIEADKGREKSTRLARRTAADKAARGRTPRHAAAAKPSTTENEKPRTGQLPSSKASRAAR